METFYITPEEFWDWFNRDESQDDTEILHNKPKRMKTDGKARIISETEAGSHADARYIILYGRHKPGKKTKTWEGDGYLSMVGQVAHLCDLHGRLLEDPILIDEVDHQEIERLGELTLGSTDVQVIEVDKRR